MVNQCMALSTIFSLKITESQSTWQCDRHPVLIAGPPVDDGGKSKRVRKENGFLKLNFILDYRLDPYIIIIF